jgi:V/A-type H+-transporting ATPase subunit D
MEQIAVTRSELLARRGRLSLARRGRDLLEQKRDQLMDEFRNAAQRVLSEAGGLDRTAAAGRRALAYAEAADGPEAVRSAGLAARRELELSARPATVSGVRIAQIEFAPVGRPRLGRGYTAAGSSPHVDRAAEAFEAVVEQTLRLAVEEVRLRRISEEIGKATRRVNALERVVIPRLEAEIRMIASQMEERERHDRFRLKRLKDRKAAQAGARP